MREDLMKYLRQKERFMYVSYRSEMLFVDEPSADSVARILEEGYDEITGTEEADKLIKTYDDCQKHGLAKNRVFVRETAKK